MSKQWAADGSGPCQAVGAEWAGLRDEERCGFTFCVRAPLFRLKELGYAHNLRGLLRKWAKTWSCDVGVLSVIFRYDRRQKSVTEFRLEPAEVLFSLRRPAERILLDGKTGQAEEKSPDDIFLLFTGWTLTFLWRL